MRQQATSTITSGMVHDDYSSRIGISCRQRSTLEFTFSRASNRTCIGAFTDFSVCMVLLGTDPLSAVFYMTIETDSVKAPSLWIERQLKGPTCLHVGKYDTISFISSDLKRSGPDTYCLNGAFTLRGITRPVQFKLFHDGGVTHKGSDLLRSNFTFISVISRSDFAMPGDLTRPGTRDKIYLHACIQFAPKRRAYELKH